MGTSSIYTGFSSENRSSLLPDDFDDEQEGSSNEVQKDDSVNTDTIEDVDADKKEQGDLGNEIDKSQTPLPNKQVSWKDAKSAFTSIYSGTRGSIKGAISKYVKAHGGAKSATKTAISGRVTAYNLSNFVSEIGSNGVKNTLGKWSINYENKSLKQIFNDIINILSPDPITKEDSIARKAMINTMEELYEELENVGYDIQSDETIQPDLLDYVIPKYIESYIYERIINDLGSRIEYSKLSIKEIAQKEQEMKDTINAIISGVFDGRNFSETSLSEQEVDSLYNQCYTKIESE